MPETNNMTIWEQVCKTDPAMTKQVTQRGGFTAICAQWQVQRATEAFGPVGKGWGYTVEYSELVVFAYALQFADVTVWHGKGCSYGPVRGCNALVDAKGRLDDDEPPKKAMTDALTKALSHLGFSADVFLGKFNDNKYIAKMNNEFGNTEPSHDEQVAADGNGEQEPTLDDVGTDDPQY